MPDPRYLSPLRYPGGKRKLAPFIAATIAAQPRKPTRYVEPFAGGAAIALRLLADDVVTRAVINDLDAGVAAFWRAVFHHTDALTARIRRCAPTMNVWHAQHRRYIDVAGDDVELGFATFFLNRTNRSGILGARPIGGLEQTGRWKLDARFNRDELADRIEYIAGFRKRVTLSEEDGIDLAAHHVTLKTSFTYVDPPYITHSEDLYFDPLTAGDHRRLASALRAGHRWVLTYDKNPKVLRLYPQLRCASFGMAHTAASQHVGVEYAVFADELELPDLALLNRRQGHVTRSVARRAC